MKKIVIAILCVIITCTIGISVYAVLTRSAPEEQNPNAVLITVPEQEKFEFYSK